MPSIKPANVGDKQYYINLLHIYLPSLKERMDVKLVTPYLASLGLLNLGKRHSYNHFIEHVDPVIYCNNKQCEILFVLLFSKIVPLICCCLISTFLSRLVSFPWL